MYDANNHIDKECVLWYCVRCITLLDVSKLIMKGFCDFIEWQQNSYGLMRV